MKRLILPGAIVSDHETKQIRSRILAAWRARYERLGWLTGVLYFGGLVGGLFVSVRLCEIATITLMHPLGGYFAEGLRYADPHGRWLTNGEAVPVSLRLLTPLLYVLLMCSWVFGSLFAIAGVARLLSGRSAED